MSSLNSTTGMMLPILIKPKPEAIKKAVDAYWAHGIALHVDCGPSCVMDPATGALWEAQSRSNAVPHEDPITTSTSVLGSLGDGPAQSVPAVIAGQASMRLRRRISAGRDQRYFGTECSRASWQEIPGNYAASHAFRGKAADRRRVTSLSTSFGATVNNVGNLSEQAGTFTHELGHNLGLPHGGCATNGGTTFNCELTPYKPNYLA